MKKTMLTFIATVVCVIALHAFRATRDTVITGRVSPPGGVQVIWAISGKDSVKTMPVEGSFSLMVQPGVWNIIINAKAPYRDAMLQNVQVTEGETTNVGEIRLQQ